jgi:hypothetical protein
VDLGHPAQPEPLGGRGGELLPRAAVEEVAEAVANEDRFAAPGQALVRQGIDRRGAGDEPGEPWSSRRRSPLSARRHREAATGGGATRGGSGRGG